MRIFLFPLLILFSAPATAQPLMVADTAALGSIDGIVNELLRLISSEPGKAKNLPAVERLFLPTARFTVLMNEPEEGASWETVDLASFLELLADPYYAEGYLEYEVHKVVDRYNGIAQVFQTYRGTDRDQAGETGITSYQLLFAEGRWWIVNVLWTGDGNGVAVPARYLPARG